MSLPIPPSPPPLDFVRPRRSAASLILLDSVRSVLVISALEDFRTAAALLPLFLFGEPPSSKSTKSFRMNTCKTPRFAPFYRFLSSSNPRRMNTYKTAPQVLFLKDLRNVSISLESTVAKKWERGVACPFEAQKPEGNIARRLLFVPRSLVDLLALDESFFQHLLVAE